MKLIRLDTSSFPDPPGPPESPEIVETFGDHITLTWQPPAFDGGSPVTGYYVERCVSTSTRWLKVTKEAISELTFSDTEVIEDNEYSYRIMAENKVGVGAPCSPTKPVIAKDPWRTYQDFSRGKAYTFVIHKCGHGIHVLE